MKLAAIVPATDQPTSLAACLAALHSAADPPEDVIAIEEPVSLSAAAARNLGVGATDADVLVFIDSDVAIHPDVFTRIREHFEKDSELSALFGSYDANPGADGFVSAFRNLLHHHVHQRGAGPAETFWTGIGAVDRDGFVAVDGFDETLSTMEDVDFGMRLAATGRRIVLDPQIQGTHLKSWSLWTMVRTDFAGRGVPWVVLLLRQGRNSTALNLGWRYRLSSAACLVAGAALVKRHRGIAAASTATFVALNKDFHVMLLRRFGVRKTAVGIGLHALHHLVGIASVPAGVLTFLSQRRREHRRR